MKPNVQSLSEQIYAWIKEKIVTGALKPGERINVDSLAEEIGVSRTPLRDAFNRLALEGMVIINPRRGTVVAQLSLDDVREVYQARQLLEPGVCSIVAANASNSFIDDLQQIQREWESIDLNKVYRDFAVTFRYVELNAAFHLRLVEETGNSRLRSMISQLYIQPRIAPLIYGTNYQGPHHRMAEHRAIIAAISDRDSQAAYQAMLKHLSVAGSNLISFLDTPHTQEQPAGIPFLSRG